MRVYNENHIESEGKVHDIYSGDSKEVDKAKAIS